MARIGASVSIRVSISKVMSYNYGLQVFRLGSVTYWVMLNAHLPTGSRQLALSPTAD